MSVFNQVRSKKLSKTQLCGRSVFFEGKHARAKKKDCTEHIFGGDSKRARRVRMDDCRCDKRDPGLMLGGHLPGAKGDSRAGTRSNESTTHEENKRGKSSCFPAIQRDESRPGDPLDRPLEGPAVHLCREEQPTTPAMEKAKEAEERKAVRCFVALTVHSSHKEDARLGLKDHHPVRCTPFVNRPHRSG